MASEIEICNIALSRIGNSRSINSMTEASKEAVQCNLHYAQCRDSVLADFPWNFATKKVALANTNNPPPNWTYAYRYPNDCLKAIGIVEPHQKYRRPDTAIHFHVGSDENGTGRLIFTDHPSAWLEYVARITDVNMFDALFKDALAWRLAAELARPLASNAGIGGEALQIYQGVIKSAAAHSLSESAEPTDYMDEFTQARLS
ncbi:hypothetical protein GWI96_05725 [Proteus sp. G4380]|uniref:hypothetical protein n=1 Tax=Proteus TaxID=583 RepID=UPI00073B05E2|nr:MULTISPECIES: hypothetical protein [Proteus]ELA7681419.1 hypothetical protein [Proteus mirabilis]KSW14201.1 hypothetical protein OL98_17030 [Proteus mirabilis]MBI6473127.1 hypothetical protein [Proteus mirabilis]MBI6508664.1 hypothetical protein [Proteus mirabilis]MDF7466261.1 hypothetical protein [Proteus mirabilis]